MKRFLALFGMIALGVFGIGAASALSGNSHPTKGCHGDNGHHYGEIKHGKWVKEHGDCKTTTATTTTVPTTTTGTTTGTTTTTTTTVAEPIVIDVPAIYLCFNSAPTTIGGVPGTVTQAELATRLAQGAYAPIAVSTAEATKQGIPTYKWTKPDGVHVLVCDPDGLKGTGTGINGSGGDFLDQAAWKTTLAEPKYGPLHLNHYEIFS